MNNVHVHNGIIFDRDPATIDPVDLYLDYGIGNPQQVMRLLAERLKAAEARIAKFEAAE